MQISLQSDIKRLKSDLERINKKALPRATQQAINRTVTGVKTDAVKAINQETGIQQKNIRPELKVIKASSSSLVATVDSRTGKASNLINFVSKAMRKPGAFNKRNKSGKYRSPGVKAKAWGKTKTYKGTFIGTGKGSSKPLVFARTSSKRTPLKSIAGPSIRGTFIKPRINELMVRSARERFEKAFTATTRNEINKALSRR